MPFGQNDDLVKLRRMATYFRDLADQNGARLLVAETIASKNRQELERKTRGFSLLSRLSSDESATEAPPILARILAGHVNSMLNMSRTVVLVRDPIESRFNVLSSVGYPEPDQRRLTTLSIEAPEDVIAERRAVSTLTPLRAEDKQAFNALDIRHFIAMPVVAEEQVRAFIVTGRIREQRPFSPPLNASDLETICAIGGFFGAYLSRHQLIQRDREQNLDRIADVERLVTERTAEIERQRALLDLSIKKLNETQQQLIMREKLATLGELTAGVAHEIQNPLNFVNNFADLSRDLLEEINELIEAALPQLDVAKRDGVNDLFMMLDSNLAKIAEHGKRADNIVRNMLQHSRGDSGSAQLCDLNALLAESIDFAYHAARVQDPQLNVAISRDFDATLKKQMLAPQEVSRVFVNLMSNAFYALKKRRKGSDAGYRPKIVITTQRLDKMAEVRLRDNGVGIPADIRARIFTPFFTTKPTGEGTGLGLSLTYDIIVKGHGGSIEVESRDNEFTEFIIRIPL